MSNNIPEGITHPPVDDLLEQVDSKYRLVLFAAKRARQINAYYAQLGEGLLDSVGPLVETAPQEKPLSIALREMQAGQLQYTEIDPIAEAAARAEAFSDPDFDLTDPLGDDLSDPLGDLGAS
ncbi:DNA-directed RNA polymerase subunit omega [Propionibacterium sp. oral taxon 192 str. F0372]|uniref:DNA-directed RNA polymerase subunit omega n=1 Tax=Propionibacterium sp. oral taxon 192 TaxID=671222 RepID=UPI0003544CA6|nr:DNA-directed RNA polymerase subunit omega [Propionibacterium sp. oral taxon 192]EPH02774.1 DNA-directed RNA polymerase subunit omega [Propionibacterium sp. oral taxon 192 str. F0372]